MTLQECGESPVLNAVLIMRVSKNSITVSQFLWYVCVCV
jgi:hypothetical protein